MCDANKTVFTICGSLIGLGGIYEVITVIAKTERTALLRASRDFSSEYKDLYISDQKVITRDDYYKMFNHCYCEDWSKL